MMEQSATLRGAALEMLETWRRFYNGPNFGLIDIEIAEKELPWLVGISEGVTLDTTDQLQRRHGNQCAIAAPVDDVDGG